MNASSLQVDGSLVFDVVTFVNELEKENAELKKQNADFEARLEKLEAKLK